MYIRSLIALFFLASHLRGTDQPNILWITSEDNGPYLGCYGDVVADTPNLDSLAEKGVRYTNFFANAPVCAVARSSWIFGVPAVSIGTHQMRSRYRVPVEQFHPYPLLLKNAGYYVTNRVKTDYNTSSIQNSIWDECSKAAHYKNRREGQPFFAVFNIGVSHEGQIFDSQYPKHYQEAGLTDQGIHIPPYQVDSEEVLHDWKRAYDRIRDMDFEVGQLLQELEKSGETEDTIVVYCSDHGGITLRSKRYLHDSGTRVPLIVYIPEKWKHLRDNTLDSVTERLSQFIDLPRTFMALAGAEVPDHMTGRILFGAMQERPAETVFLFSGRFDEAPDMSRAVTDGSWKYIRNYEPDRPRFQMLSYPLNQKGQQAQYKWYRQGKTNDFQAAQYLLQPPEELYDTMNDPYEVNNLAGDKSSVERLIAMRKALDQHIIEARDLGFIPEPLMAEIDSDNSETLFEFAQSDINYPLSKILPIANLASTKDVKNIDQLVEALSDDNQIVRYWGILGLRVLGQDALTVRNAIEVALKDESPSVRITAAICLGNLGQTKQAADVLLIEAAEARTDAHSLWALDGIKYLGVPEAIEGKGVKDLTRGPYSRRTFEYLAKGGSMNQLPAGSFE